MVGDESARVRDWKRRWRIGYGKGGCKGSASVRELNRRWWTRGAVCCGGDLSFGAFVSWEVFFNPQPPHYCPPLFFRDQALVVIGNHLRDSRQDDGFGVCLGEAGWTIIEEGYLYCL
jgi:hypothetical protein